MEDLRFIHFFGPDGSGKTTQAKMIVRHLSDKGVRARIFWVRSPHTLAYVLWRVFIRIGFYRVIWNPFGVGIKLPKVNSNRFLRTFWVIIEFLSVIPHIIRAKILISRGYTLVAERYLLDTITTIAFFIDDINFIKGFTARALIRFIPRNAILIFIDADFQTIFERRAPLFFERMQNAKKQGKKNRRRVTYGYVPDSAVEPEEFINFQRNAYRLLAKSVGAFEIYSPNFSVAQTFDIILQFLKKHQ